MSDSAWKTPPQKPISEFVVNDLETLRVLADPLRIQIIELVTHQPRTVKQVAADLDLPPTKLYYHIKQLEERGLIRVVDTRLVSGIVEKQYQAAAFSYHVNKALFSPTSPTGQEGLNVMLTGLFEDARADIQESVAEGAIDLYAEEGGGAQVSRALLIARNTLYLTPARAEEFYRRMRALIREFVSGVEDPSVAEQAYGLLLALYPTTRPYGRDEDERQINKG
ncbi:MAG: helix-turn-helix transcriptional regulator [Chloroflexi bacterium]|nr:helix-turn-helix transcriptional regulator [Chloroflexota bacterium]